MDCKEARRLVPMYIRDELDDDTAQQLLDHIKHCSMCEEELSIYYTIEEGLKQLEDDSYNKDAAITLEQKMQQTFKRSRAIYLNNIWMYAIDTLVLLSLIVTMLLQIRVWHEMGFF